MNKISAVIITFNEESNIVRCLESVKDIADEIVVVDSYSTDKTKDLCIRFGVRFLEHPFKGHIDQKNYAASLAVNDYVLSLDADEALSPELRKSILDIKNSLVKDGYYMNRCTNYLGKWIRHGAWYPDRKMRLFNRHRGFWAGQDPHDSYKLQDSNNSGYIKGDIEHYSYVSMDDHVKQFNTFTSISAREMFQEGRKATVLNICFNPLVSFIKGFFFKLGFLDGYYGIVICIINAFATFIKYIKLRELNRKKL